MRQPVEVKPDDYPLGRQDKARTVLRLRGGATGGASSEEERNIAGLEAAVVFVPTEAAEEGLMEDHADEVETAQGELVSPSMSVGTSEGNVWEDGVWARVGAQTLRRWDLVYWGTIADLFVAMGYAEADRVVYIPTIRANT